MSPYRFWNIPFYSCYSAHLYVHVARTWQGFGLLYLIGVLAVCSLSTTYRLGVVMESVLQERVMPVIDKLPVLTFEQGQLSVAAPQPLVILDPVTEQPMVVIDTTGKTTSLEQHDVPLLLMKDRALARQGTGMERTLEFAGLNDVQLDNDAIRSGLQRAMGFIKPFAYIPVLLMESLYRMAQVFLYAVGGLLFASLLKVSLPYTVLLRLTCVAMTPGLLLTALLELFGIGLPLGGLLFFILSQLYLYFAIRSVALDSHTHNDPHYLEV
ncbi:MAG: DUF1189 family protein [Aeromonadaceae bacterium]